MYCPRCGAEYQPGVALCADCGVPLAAAPPASEAPDLVDAEEILATYNAGDIAIVKSLLEANRIPYLFHGENFTVVDPLIQPARLLVAPEYAERVRELLRDVDLNFMGISHGKTSLPDDEPES